MAWDYTNDYSSTILVYISGAGTITVVSVTGLPASGKYFILKVDDEYFLCTSYTGLVLTVTGGQAGSTPANHSLGAAITGCWIVPSVLDGIKSDVIAAVALVLLEQHTASNTASLDFTACITSAYDEYLIEINGIVPITSGDNIIILFSTDGGSTWQTTGYYWHYQYLSEIGDNGAQGGNAQASIQVATGINSSSSGGGVVCSIRLYNPLGSTYKHCIFQSTEYHINGHIYGLYGAIAGRLDATAVNAIRVVASTSNLASGTIRVYGMSK